MYIHEQEIELVSNKELFKQAVKLAQMIRMMGNDPIKIQKAQKLNLEVGLKIQRKLKEYYSKGA